MEASESPPVITPLAAGLLVPAGVLAGATGSAGGITSLVSYPALLLAGLPRLPANIANQVAVSTSWPGAALGSRQELRGQLGWLLRWCPVAAAGGVAGGVLLKVTSSSAFARVVPFLVAIGALVLLLEPLIARVRRTAAGAGSRWTLPGCLAPLSLYNGYFGAGSGVLTLTLMLLTVDRRLPVANALKNMLVGAGSAAAAIVFVVAGPVHWNAVIPLGIGTFLGGRVGPAVTRRVPERGLRVVIALLGLGLAVDLWLTA